MVQQPPLPNALILHGSTMNTQRWVGTTLYCGFCVIFEHASNRKHDEFYAVLHTFMKYYYQLLEIRCREIALGCTHTKCKPITAPHIWGQKSNKSYGDKCI